MKLAIILAVASLLWLTGCATAPASHSGPSFWQELAEQMQKDPRDAPWDSAEGRQLFEQTPNWDRAAEKICCGHLRTCRPHQSPRC